MALKGDLRDFPVTSLFNLVNLASKTGRLVIEGKSRSARVYFKDGKLIQAMIGNPNGDLTSILVKSGKITAEQANTVKQRARSRTDKELGLLLLSYGYCNQRDIVQAVKTQILSNVYPLFAWTEGSFYFEPNVVPPDDQVTISLNLENIIIEGTRWIKEWEKLTVDLPSLEVTLSFVPKPTTHMKEIQLSTEEWRLLTYINPKNSLRQIAKACGMDEFQARKIVYRLLQAGLVQIVNQPPAKVIPSSPPKAPAPSEAKPLGMPPPPKIDRGLIGKIIQKIKSLGG